MGTIWLTVRLADPDLHLVVGQVALVGRVGGRSQADHDRDGDPQGQADRGHTTEMSRIAIIGAGAWGTGLSIVLGRKGTHNIRLWALEPEVRDSIAARHVNERFLPGQTIPECVLATCDLKEALKDAEILVSVMPSQHTRSLFLNMRAHLHPDVAIVSATKGLEETTLLRMSEVIRQVLDPAADFQLASRR